MKRVKILSKMVLVNLLVFVALLGMLEVFVIGALRVPGLIPSGRVLELFRSMYLKERAIIQFTRECARYDEELGYTLKPGVCTFSNLEFSNTFQINSLGLRDDEISLKAPEVVVLGDSHAMGWGVEQHQTFAEILESNTRLTTLNAAVSSYGTAREVRMLQRIDTSRLKILVIQYCNNDFKENKDFLAGGGGARAMSLEKYSKQVAALEASRYRPGQYVHELFVKRLAKPALRGLVRTLRAEHSSDGKNKSEPSSSEPSKSEPSKKKAEAKAFLGVLEEAHVEREPVLVVALEVNAYARNSSLFVDALEQELERREVGPRLSRLKIADVSELLDARHHFRLDDHLNALGHEVVAKAILGEIQIFLGGI